MANSMILTILVKPECLNDFLGAMKEAMPDTRAYEGCQQVDVWTSEDEPGKVMIFETWETKAHQEKYFAWRMETGMMDALAPMLRGEPAVTWLKVHDL